MFLRLLLLFALMPIVELALLIEIGRRLGTWIAVALVFGTGAIGAILARSQGLRTFRRLRQTIAAGSFHGDELIDAALILAGGLLLIAPGVITDLIGLAALLPGTRHLFRTYLKRAVRRRLQSGIIDATYRVNEGKWKN